MVYDMGVKFLVVTVISNETKSVLSFPEVDAFDVLSIFQKLKTNFPIPENIKLQKIKYSKTY